MTRVFVYGSLLRGETNHRLLASARFVTVARTRPEFTLHDLGAFPGLVAGGATSVVGEVYEVDGPTRVRLDRLEGHPQLYRRELIELVTDHGGLTAHVYVYVSSLGRAQAICSGDWRQQKEQAR